MKLLPFEKYQIYSSKPPAEISAAIASQCEAWKFSFSFSKNNKPLTGWCKNNSFEIYRSIGYRNSFLPVAFGEIIANNGGSIVNVKLRMNLLVIGFLCLWISGVVVIGIAIAIKAKGVVALGPLFMFLFAYVITQGGFWFEVPIIKKLIAGLV